MNLEHEKISVLFGIDAPDAALYQRRIVDEAVKQNIPPKKRYLFRKSLLIDLLANKWHQGDEPIYLYGPTGSGKTSVGLQLASRLNIPVWPVTCHAEMELQSLYGHYVLEKDGSTAWMDGPLTQAARHGGICLLNEIDRLRPEVFVGLNDVLEYVSNNGFTLTAHHGEFVVPKEGFNIICTGNTNLAGDMTGSHSTANIHDKSVLDRFGMALEVQYMTPEEEAVLVSEVFDAIPEDDLKLWFADEDIKVGTGTTILEGEHVTRKDFVKAMVEVASMIRSQSVDQGNGSGAALERTMSTRTLLRWAGLCIKFRAATTKGLSVLHYSMQRAFSNTCTTPSKVAVEEILNQVFSVKPELQSS